MGCFVNNPLRSNALHTAAFISTHLQWQNIYLASSLCWLYVCIYLDHTTTLQNTLKLTSPSGRGWGLSLIGPKKEAWYNCRNTKQGSSGYLNDSDGVTKMGGSLGPPSEGSPTVGADLDDLFVSWGPIAWGIILERDVGRLDVSLFNTWKNENEMKNREIKNRDIISRRKIWFQENLI